MATFGPIASPNPNVLFDPGRAIGMAQDIQRNQLLMQNATDDRRLAGFERDRKYVAETSAMINSLPEGDRPAAYLQAVGELNRQGIALNAPKEYPGHAQIAALAQSDLTGYQRAQLQEKRDASQAMLALLGGGMPAAAGVAPVSVPVGPAVRASAGNPLVGPFPPEMMSTPAGPAIPPPGDPGRNAALLAQRDANLGAGPEQLAAASAARGATGAPQIPGGYRAPDGVAGQYAGLAPPTGVINANVGGAAPAAAGPAVGPNGLTAEQTLALAALSRTNPNAVPMAMAQARRENAAAAERAGDNARQTARDAENDRRFGLQQDQTRLTNERLTAAQERQAAAEQRAAERAGLLPGWVRGPDGKPTIEEGGPADPAVIARQAQARGEGKPGKSIPGAERDKLLKEGGTRDSILGLRDSFKNDFGGYKIAAAGDVANTIERNTTGGPRSDWWQQYDRQKNLIRNELFGASLQPNETAAFEKADINPGMSPETIRTNLGRQAAIIDTALRRRAKSMTADGYSTEAIEEATGLRLGEAAPASGGGVRVKVSTPDEARKLPSGTLIELPDGSPGVVP